MLKCESNKAGKILRENGLIPQKNLPGKPKSLDSHFSI